MNHVDIGDIAQADYIDVENDLITSPGLDEFIVETPEANLADTSDESDVEDFDPPPKPLLVNYDHYDHITTMKALNVISFWMELRLSYVHELLSGSTDSSFGISSSVSIKIV